MCSDFLPIAHRGGARLAANIGLENSVVAFGNAVALGYRWLETDVQVSRDGVVFAIHDESLDRVTDSSGIIGELDAADVREALIGGVEPVPELATLFETFPDACFNIDVKTDASVEPTLAVVRAYDAVDRVCIASFSDARLRRVRRLMPGVATSLGPFDVGLLRFAPTARLRATGARRGAGSVQVPRERYGITLVKPSFVRHAHEAGLQVHVWTVDEASAMTELLDMSVDGIVTDRPDVLRDVLIDRGMWHPA